jgi:uncharacterized membrane protein YhaH (DUF805 family)
MGDLSIWHILIFVLVLLAIVFGFIYPVVRIVQRTGHSGWWCLLVFVPFGTLIGLWLLATADWPALERT